MNATLRGIASAALVFALIFGAAPAAAQTDTASIVGTVSDQSGAVLPDVTVTATQHETAVAATAVTNESGQFVFPSLKIGTYTVAAELEGFKRAVRSDVTLNVQDRASLTFTMEVGQLTEEILVRGGTALLQTTTASIGHSVDERQLKNLPLLGRRYAELAFLTPGVVPAISRSMVIGADYVGNITRNARKIRNLNQGIIGPGNVVRFPYAQYGYGSAFLEQMTTESAMASSHAGDRSGRAE